MLDRSTKLRLRFFLTLCIFSLSSYFVEFNQATGSIFSTKGSWYYRMTVVIETPEGVKSGSSVRQISYHTEPHLGDVGGTYYSVSKGDAVMVDLGPRGIVFALLRGQNGDEDYAHSVALSAFPSKELTPAGTKIALNSDAYPLFATFSRLSDPKTLQVIDPRADQLRKFGKDRGRKTFAEAFGDGVILKEISIEATTDPVTSTIEYKLPWLSQLSGYISGMKSCGGQLMCLDRSDFERKKFVKHDE